MTTRRTFFGLLAASPAALIATPAPAAASNVVIKIHGVRIQPHGHIKVDGGPYDLHISDCSFEGAAPWVEDTRRSGE